MRSVARTMLGTTFMALVLSVFLNVILVDGVRANIITNGDFSTGTFEGWNTSGNLSIATMASLPEEWRTNWDLTSWNSVMNGNFALMQASSYLQTSTNFTTTIPLSSSSRPISLSYDYAVASDALNSPYNTVAYFRLELVAKNFNESRKYYLVYSEPMWSATPQKQVFTGTVKLSEDYFLRGIGPTAESYDEQFEIWVSFWNPFGYNYIVGIDNIDLEVLPANSNAAPVPEPASCILLVAGLAGVGIYARRKRSMKLA